MKKSIFSLLFLIGCATMSSAQVITFTEVSHYFDHTKGNRKEYKAVEPRDDYELVLERVRQQVYASQPVEKMDQGATSLMKMLTPEGTWPQIDYKCFFRTNWEPVTHLNYVRQLATAYTCPESSLYGNFMLFRAIDKALRTWNKYQPRSYNWWYNDISAPKIMADIFAVWEWDKIPGTTTPEGEVENHNDWGVYGV